MNFKYTQNANAKTPIILIDDYIGADDKGNIGIEEAQFTREILALKNLGVKSAEMWINSKGGLWSTSVGIVSAMNNSGIDFTTVNMGFADSSAGHIFQAGRHRVWMSHSLGLLHEIQGRSTPDVLEAMNNSVATMLCGKTKATADEVRGLMKANTMMDSDMAEKYGFCDEVRNGHDILKFTNCSDAYEAGQTKIKQLLPKTTRNMSQVNAILGLTNEASEASQLEAINRILQAKNKAEADVVTLTKERDAALAGKLVAENSLAVKTQEVLDATNVAKREKAEALVEQHRGTRIADDKDIVNRFVELAIADYDGTKTILESMNVNKQAPPPPGTPGNPGQPSKVTNSAAAYYQQHLGK